MADINSWLHKQHLNTGKIINCQSISKPLKDVEEKIISMNETINELHNQRNYAYKDSVKVKKTIHSQINQIIKCFQERENFLLLKVDEAYMLQDLKINEELAKLHSTLAQCEILYNCLENFNGDMDVISKINNMYQEMNLEEKLSIDSLEFSSDFEKIKEAAFSYGILSGEFSKKEDVLPEILDNDIETLDSEIESSHNSNTISSGKRSSSQDSFEVIDLFENMHCQDISKNPTMGKQNTESFNTVSDEINKFKNTTFSEKSFKEMNSSHEDDWELMTQLKKKLQNCTSVSKMSIMPNKSDNCIYPRVQSSVNNTTVASTLFLKDSGNWLHSKSNCITKLAQSQYSGKDTASYKIQQAFKPYFIKDDIKNWLSCNK